MREKYSIENILEFMFVLANIGIKQFFFLILSSFLFEYINLNLKDGYGWH